jgi:hypothetical protein
MREGTGRAHGDNQTGHMGDMLMDLANGESPRLPVGALGQLKNSARVSLFPATRRVALGAWGLGAVGDLVVNLPLPAHRRRRLRRCRTACVTINASELAARFVFLAHGVDEQAADGLACAGGSRDYSAAEREAALFPAQDLAQERRRFIWLAVERRGG